MKFSTWSVLDKLLDTIVEKFAGAEIIGKEKNLSNGSAWKHFTVWSDISLVTRMTNMYAIWNQYWVRGLGLLQLWSSRG